MDVAYIEDVYIEGSDYLEIEQNDVIIYLSEDREVSGRLLTGAGDTVCIESDVKASIKTPDNPAYCQRELLLGKYEMYVVHDDPKDPLYSLLQHSGVVHVNDLVAARPLVVTNLRFLDPFIEFVLSKLEREFPALYSEIEKLYVPDLPG